MQFTLTPVRRSDKVEFTTITNAWDAKQENWVEHVKSRLICRPLLKNNLETFQSHFRGLTFLFH